jgi:2-polyprenyl-6-methoxyphenol hydroxylase-like FAD-dependent oxidoreductase
VENRTVLVSGASIAGPALAYWLRRFGFRPRVVEVAPAVRPGGQAVDIRGVARDVVERMGVLDEIKRVSVDERGMAYVDGRGRRKASLPVDLFDGEGIVAEIEIMRGDLTRVLVEATGGVEYLFDDRIVGLDQDADKTMVTFASGTRRAFDLVIGADGVHSGVRALAFGPEHDYVRPLGGYIAYFTVADPGNLDHWFLMYNEPGGKGVAIRPENGGTAKAMLSFRSPPLDYDRRDVAAQRRILAERFAGVGWITPSLLAAMDTAPDFYFDSFCQVHVERWWRGRVALVGDAGYCASPLSGLGTSLSLVGAYVLAGELAATPDHEDAFRRYQEVLGEYVKQCQELPPGGIKGFAPDGRLMISMRNLSMRMMNRWPMRAMIAKQFQKADNVALPNYPISAENVVI